MKAEKHFWNRVNWVNVTFSINTGKKENVVNIKVKFKSSKVSSSSMKVTNIDEMFAVSQLVKSWGKVSS